jgi:hypothetical protein
MSFVDVFINLALGSGTLCEFILLDYPARLPPLLVLTITVGILISEFFDTRLVRHRVNIFSASAIWTREYLSHPGKRRIVTPAADHVVDT